MANGVICDEVLEVPKYEKLSISGWVVCLFKKNEIH